MLIKILETAMIHQFLLTALVSSSVSATIAGTMPSTDPTWVTFQIGGWQFSPVVSESSQTTKAFLAHYTGTDSYSGNLSVVLFERTAEGNWLGVTWPGGDLGMAASYVIASRREGKSIKNDPVIQEALDAFDTTESDLFLAPSPYSLGMSASDPMFQTVAGVSQPGVLLDHLRITGYPVTPELPAILAVAAARAAGDQLVYDEVLHLSLGESPEAEPESVSLAAASLTSETLGTEILLNALATRVESILFGIDLPETFFWPCGCTTISAPCVYAPPATLCRSSQSTGGQYHCAYCHAGVGTWSQVGQTFWLCNPCIGTGTYTCNPPNLIVDSCTLDVPCPVGGCP